ncbi:GGDEF domain-containing protein [Niveibacterium sp. 24ML]|uniref:GGDEF domain-containing protein n=1 Tax=Niveibacterium sp. 24ML TaxID=2985512 RepID=UPI00226FC1F9|nr:GGDEF domain-containing protein [Niveibacterium sp. 24ML]MCX9155478.1 GGDEF domain-containing protein [Niveibacterium sp. 24ML]
MLDLNSVLFATTLVALSMGLVLRVFIRSFEPLMRGARPVAWGSLALAAGTATLALRGAMPALELPALALGNLCLLVSQGLIHVGLCRLVDRRARVLYVAGVLVSTYLCVLWYGLVTPDAAVRTIAFSFGLFVTIALTMWELYKSLRLRRPSITLALFCVLGLMEVSLIVRAVLAWLARGQFDSVGESPAQSFIVLAVMLALVFVILLCMTLIGERATARLRESSQFEDLLTGLPNRRAANDAIEAALAGNAEAARPTTVVRVDLDNFRQFNDWYGHDVGDAVLRHVTSRLRRLLGRREMLARWSGKGYIVVMPDAGPEQGAGMARDIIMEISYSPLELGGFDVEIAACAGVATSERSESTVDALMIAADAALEMARRNPDGLASVRRID